MNILLLGSGGREHALAWKISQSPLCHQLWIAPGNGGTGQYGTNIPIGINDFAAITQHCLSEKIDLLVVGPEEPLVRGIYDFVKGDPALQHIVVVGPSAAAAQLEGSKAFSKKFMQRHGIPTAGYQEFTLENLAAGKLYLQHHPLPVVLKADGLAAGKGVVICQTNAEAVQVLEEMLVHQQFGQASSKVVVEEFLSGIEISVFVLTDGKDYQVIGHAKDYKRIGEGDTGLNTGGMGCVSPVPFANDLFMQKVEAQIIQPTVNGLATEGLVYHGFIFFGLISVQGEPFVIEYNCRLGDPETEVVLPRLKNDLVELLLQMEEGTLTKASIQYDNRFAVTTMVVSGGYPGDYQKNKPMQLPSNPGDVLLFHAGTKAEGGQLLTNGGRVITATALRPTLYEAAEASRKVVEQIQFEGKYYRRDIGWEFA
jgi:phosphoribosylamine---glycine ligase